MQFMLWSVVDLTSFNNEGIKITFWIDYLFTNKPIKRVHPNDLILKKICIVK